MNSRHNENFTTLWPRTTGDFFNRAFTTDRTVSSQQNLHRLIPALTFGLLLPHDFNRAMSMRSDGARNRSEPKSLESVVTVCADDDQISAPALGFFKYGNLRIAFDRFGRRFDSRTAVFIKAGNCFCGVGGCLVFESLFPFGIIVV